MTRIFAKLYVDTVHSGLLADIGAERWHTLCTIAAFMDRAGRCYPSQETLALRMGVTREAANRRVKRLLAYKWQNEPLVTAEKTRDEATKRWDRTVYTIRPGGPLTIFDTS